jgi:hypothetical protein
MKTIGLRTYVLTGLAAFIAGLIILLPARLLETPLDRALMSRVQITALDGSIWSGRGQIKVNGATVPIEWRFDSAQLLYGRIGYRLSLESPAARGRLRVSSGVRSLAMQDVDIDLDASVLSRDIPAMSLAGIQGNVAVRIPESETLFISHTDAIAQGHLSLHAATLTVRSVSTEPLGPIDIPVTLDDRRATFQVSAPQGALQLDGSGQLEWGAARQISFTGTARSTTPAVLNALKMIGTAMPDGRIRVDYRGAW